MPPIKCVVIGNSTAGKSSLLATYINGTYSTSSRSSYEHHLTKATTRDGTKLDLLLCDTMGLKDFDRINRLCYYNTEVFILCFSVVSSNDFYNIRLRWLPEVRKKFASVPLILVGTKVDLREEEICTTSTSITHDQGTKLAQEIGAMVYLECSALHGIGVAAVFDAAATCGQQHRSKGDVNPKKRCRWKRRCCLM